MKIKYIYYKMPKKEKTLGAKFNTKEEMIGFFKDNMTEEQFNKFSALLEEGHSCHSANKVVKKNKV